MHYNCPGGCVGVRKVAFLHRCDAVDCSTAALTVLFAAWWHLKSPKKFAQRFFYFFFEHLCTNSAEPLIVFRPSATYSPSLVPLPFLFPHALPDYSTHSGSERFCKSSNHPTLRSGVQERSVSGWHALHFLQSFMPHKVVPLLRQGRCGTHVVYGFNLGRLLPGTDFQTKCIIIVQVGASGSGRLLFRTAATP